MKELKKDSFESTEIVDQVKVEKKVTLVKQLLPHQGHKCFEYNVETNQLSYAKFVEVAIDYESATHGIVTPRRKVMIKDNCMYVTSLNWKNAIKNFSRILEKKVNPEIVKP